LNNAAVSIGPVLIVVLAALMMLAVAAAAVGRLGVSRAVGSASVRAVVQLAAVPLLITAVLRSWWATAAFITLMVLVAAATSARRIGSWSLVRFTILPIVAGALPAGTLVVVAGTVPMSAIAGSP
jgi:putative ABC transport system permease protein